MKGKLLLHTRSGVLGLKLVQKQWFDHWSGSGVHWSVNASSSGFKTCICSIFQKKKEEGVIDSSDKDIVAEAERLDVKAMGPLVLTEVLFDEKIREQIRKYRRHFLRVSNLLFCTQCNNLRVWDNYWSQFWIALLGEGWLYCSS